MAINAGDIFPCFDPSNPLQVLEIPDNIVRRFGPFEFTFKPGTKTARVSTDKAKHCYNGDYGIYINGERVSDNKVIKLIKGTNTIEVNKFILQYLPHICALKIEEDVYNTILGYSIMLNSDPKLSIHSDLIQAVLYYSWHRCHIEDRAYPKETGNLGRDKFFDKIHEIKA